MKLALFAFLLLFNTRESRQQLSFHPPWQNGKVVKIIDGDTFDVLTNEKKTIRIRMNGIDCPERKQDFYQSAKNALSGYIFNKEVNLFITGYDRNRRAIAMVYSNGDNINLVMIRSGLAWHFKKYSTDTSFANAEQQARLARKGLWSMDHPIAPWEFRKKSKRIFTGNNSISKAPALAYQGF